MPVTSRRRAPEEKRSALVETAWQLFSERGFGSTSTSAIAREAGVSEGILFHHFGTKQGILAAVAETYGRNLAEAMFEGDEPDGPPLTPEIMLRRAFTFVRQHGTLSHVLVRSSDPADWSVAVQASREKIVVALADAFDRWSNRGALRPMNPRIVAELLFALVESAIFQCFVQSDGSREEEYLSEAVRCIEGAVAPRSTVSKNDKRMDFKRIQPARGSTAGKPKPASRRGVKRRKI